MHWFTVDGPEQTDFYLDGAYRYSIVNGTAMWLRICDRLVTARSPLGSTERDDK